MLCVLHKKFETESIRNAVHVENAKHGVSSSGTRSIYEAILTLKKPKSQRNWINI